MTDISRRTLLKTALATCATYVVPVEAHELPAQPLAPVVGDTAPLAGGMTKLDKGWRFQFGNADQPAKDFDFGRAGREGTYAKNGKLLPVADAKFDDSTWQLVNNPARLGRRAAVHRGSLSS